MHATEVAVKLEDCQYKSRNTLVGAEQRWELKDVSLLLLLFFFSFQANQFVIPDTWIMLLCLQRSNILFFLHLEPVALLTRMEHVSDCSSRASLFGSVQPLGQIPALVLRLSVQNTT